MTENPGPRVAEGQPAPPASTPKKLVAQGSRQPKAENPLRRRTTELLTAYLVVVVTALIVLRATVDGLDFFGVGWIIVLATLPLMPWLLPRLGPFVKSISPYVQSFSLGAVQLELRAVQDAPIVVPTSGALAQIANDQGGFSASTTINDLALALRDLRRAGNAPVGVVDLQGGLKWKLPNLYFLCFLLEADPILTELVFTETRAGVDGYLVLTCSPSDFRRRVDQALPVYSVAASTLRLQADRTIDINYAQELAMSFQLLINGLGPLTVLGDIDPVRGYVGSARVTELVGAIGATYVDEPGGAALSEATLRTVLKAAQRYLPWTSDGRLLGIIDRDRVALAVARTALAQA